MSKLATMPMPVFAAGLRQPAKQEAPERQDPQERHAKLQWTEQWRLLRQKAELLVRGAPVWSTQPSLGSAPAWLQRLLTGIPAGSLGTQPLPRVLELAASMPLMSSPLTHPGALPKAAPSEKELFEVVQPFLEATAALERARSTEASNAWTDLQRVKQATARFRELVLHVGAGPDFVAELQEVMEGAELTLTLTLTRTLTLTPNLALTPTLTLTLTPTLALTLTLTLTRSCTAVGRRRAP